MTSISRYAEIAIEDAIGPQKIIDHDLPQKDEQCRIKMIKLLGLDWKVTSKRITIWNYYLELMSKNKIKFVCLVFLPGRKWRKFLFQKNHNLISRKA